MYYARDKSSETTNTSYEIDMKEESYSSSSDDDDFTVIMDDMDAITCGLDRTNLRSSGNISFLRPDPATDPRDVVITLGPTRNSGVSRVSRNPFLAASLRRE